MRDETRPCSDLLESLSQTSSFDVTFLVFLVSDLLMDVSPTMCPSLGGYGTPQPPWKEWSFWFLLQVSPGSFSPGSFYSSLLVPSTGLFWYLLQVSWFLLQDSTWFLLQVSPGSFSPGSFYRSLLVPSIGLFWFLL